MCVQLGAGTERSVLMPHPPGYWDAGHGHHAHPVHLPFGWNFKDIAGGTGVDSHRLRTPQATLSYPLRAHSAAALFNPWVAAPLGLKDAFTEVAKDHPAYHRFTL